MFAICSAVMVVWPLFKIVTWFPVIVATWRFELEYTIWPTLFEIGGVTWNGKSFLNFDGTLNPESEVVPWPIFIL